jgi:hypothetical protein
MVTVMLCCLFADCILLLRCCIGTEHLTACEEQLTGKTPDDLPTPFPPRAAFERVPEILRCNDLPTTYLPSERTIKDHHHQPRFAVFKQDQFHLSVIKRKL